MDNNKELVELRNEKMRDIVGKSPSYLLKSGIYIISLFILSFIFCLYLLPFTDSYSTKIKIKSYPQIDSLRYDKGQVCGEFYLPIKYKFIDLKKCEIVITVEGGKTITGQIAHVYSSVYSFSNKQYIRIEINLCDDTHLLLPTEGEVKIVFLKQSLLTLTF